MSIATLERAVVAGAREVLNNPKLRVKDLLEWSTSKVQPHDGEVVIFVPDLGTWAAFPKACDHRGAR